MDVALEAATSWSDGIGFDLRRSFSSKGALIGELLQRPSRDVESANAKVDQQMVQKSQGNEGRVW